MSVDEITKVLMLVNLCVFIWFLQFLLLKQVSVFLTKYNMNFVPLDTAQVSMFCLLKTSNSAGAARNLKYL
jgi:hypothetical protein